MTADELSQLIKYSGPIPSHNMNFNQLEHWSLAIPYRNMVALPHS
jgi:hypothetical protein